MLPNLKGVATQDLVEQIGGTGFKASYINWSRTMQLLRDHAPGWLPAPIFTGDEGSSIVHKAPVGAYLMICFMKDGLYTPGIPQAIMDNKNNAIPYEKITARDITDTHRRGVCMAAAMTFGLAYELWAKMPLENGYGEEPAIKASPNDGVELKDFSPERQIEIQEWANEIKGAGTLEQAAKYWQQSETLPVEERTCVWGLLDSAQRSAIKKILKGE